MLSGSKTVAQPPFPTFLLPSLKIPFFRRRQSNPTTASSAVSNDTPSLSSSPTSTTSTEAFSRSPPSVSTEDAETNRCKLPIDKTERKPRTTALPLAANEPSRHRLTSFLPDVIRCNSCGTDLAYGLQIVSKGFTGRHGRALLVGPPLAASTPSCPGPLAAPFLHGTGANITTADVAPGHHALAHGTANLINVTVSRPEPRNLVTGAHMVADIRCETCAVVVGWKYVDAREQSQKYKVGKFILELEKTTVVRSWEDGTGGEGVLDKHFYSSSAPVGSSSGRSRGGFSLFGGRRKTSTSSDGPGGDGTYAVMVEEESSASENEEEIVFDSDDEDECEDMFAGVWDAATVAKRRESQASKGSKRKSKKARAGRDR